MLWVVEKIDRRLRCLSMVLLLFSISLGTGVVTFAQTHDKSRGQDIGIEERRWAEQRLWDLGYWAGPIDGTFDSGSRHALMAFQKVEGRPRTGKLTRTELEALQKASPPQPRSSGYAHIEIDLTRQVLFVIDETGSVSHILPVSSGNEGHYIDHGQVHRAHTPRGTFTVLRKINGWRLSSLGLMYYPSYIFNGIAVHGSVSVPARPASHGCIRVPMFAAKELSGLMPVGIEVIVYESRREGKV